MLTAGQWFGVLLAATWAAVLAVLLTRAGVRRRHQWRQWNGDTVAGAAATSLTAGAQPSAALIVAEVSARLRAGALVGAAWDETLRPYLNPDGSAPPGQAEGGVDELGVPRGLNQIAALRPTQASIAAACRLTQELGIALADVLDRVLEGIEDADAARAERAVARAGPTLTARLLTGLPLLGFAGASALGANLVGFALDGTVGTACFLAGVSLWVGGMAWTRALIANSDPPGVVDGIVVVELVAAAVAAGASIPRALEAVGIAASLPDLQVSSRLLRLGASYPQVSHGLRGIELELVKALRPAWFVGAAPEALLRLLARRQRRERTRLARESAQRLAVKLVVPLGLCLLPAFVLLAVVPIVVTLFI